MSDVRPGAARRWCRTVDAVDGVSVRSSDGVTVLAGTGEPHEGAAALGTARGLVEAARARLPKRGRRGAM